jgi:hypothetical protein
VGTVTVPPVVLTGGADYTLLVTTDSPTGTTATATLLPDDNSLSTNAAKPDRVRLVHGATTSNELSMTVGTNPVDNVVHGAASAYILSEASGSTVTPVTVRLGTTTLCTGPTTLSASPSVYSSSPSATWTASRWGLASSSMTADRDDGCQSRDFHFRLSFTIVIHAR